MKGALEDFYSDLQYFISFTGSNANACTLITTFKQITLFSSRTREHVLCYMTKRTEATPTYFFCQWYECLNIFNTCIHSLHQWTVVVGVFFFRNMFYYLIWSISLQNVLCIYYHINPALVP